MEKQFIKVEYSKLEVQTESRRPKRSAHKIVFLCAVLVLICYLFGLVLEQDYTLKHQTVLTLDYTHNLTLPVEEFPWKEQYWVNTSQCQMVSLNPYASDALGIFKKKIYLSCESDPAVIIATYDQFKRVYTLRQMDREYICCYKKVMRDQSRSTVPADQRYKLARCRIFFRNIVVPSDVSAIITVCKRRRPWLRQMDAFSFMHPIKEAVNKNFSTQSKPSVLLWGIDSMSRMNLPRTMPILYNYLNEGDWYELQGYNKVGDNTFSNILALLAGYNETHSELVCRPRQVGGLDACPLVWKDFKQLGYVTAYAEDCAECATFNSNSFKGFREPPTDVYLQHFLVALKKELGAANVTLLPHCLGRRHSAEYVYDAAIQFTQVYKDQPSFGLFWSNSFSHNDFSLPSAKDEKIVQYMRKLYKNGIMKNTIIFFFSNHGMRFGPLRNLKSGFLEERLPIMYLRLPQWFKKKYNKYVINLKQNRNRLTSPYDIYATVRHILELDTLSELLPRPEGCPTCHSVFEEISLSRNCSTAGIGQHWCTCELFSEVFCDDVAEKIANQIVTKINTLIRKEKHTDLCQKLVLSGINSLFRMDDMKTYRVQFMVKPGPVSLEGTVQWDARTELITADMQLISVLDDQRRNHCAKDENVKRFCVCYFNLND